MKALSPQDLVTMVKNCGDCEMVLQVKTENGDVEEYSCNLPVEQPEESEAGEESGSEDTTNQDNDNQ